MPKFDNIHPTVNPKPMKVRRVEINLIDREASARMGSDVYRPDGHGFVRETPLQ